MAHELRNPLAPIQNALHVMKLAGDDADAMDRARGTIERQLQHLTRVVGVLGDVSRITRNTLELRMSRVELASVIHQAVETCRPLARHLQHELAVAIPAEPIHLNADAVRLAQLFSNLLSNACRYTEPHGQIAIVAERQGSDVVVSVTDTGIGMEPDVLPTIFDMFTRADGSREQAHDGLGIGLTLARRVVEMHGGTIEAFSEGLRRGSTFQVRLPIMLDRPARRRKAAAPRRRQDPPAAARRVLVVDDNPDSAESMAELLALSGHQTAVAHDGAASVEEAAAFRPDVILMDIGLPKMNGYDAARKIRAQPWATGVVLVAITGWGQAEDREKSRAAGFDHHLVKPVDASALADLLATKAPA